MNTLQVSSVPALADNYIWLIHGLRNPHRVIAVDPGDATAARQALQRAKLQLAGILVTHHHADHIGGVAELVDEFAVSVHGPAQESIPGNPLKMSDGMQVVFDALGLEFAVLDVPGHTAGHIAYLGHGSLFCGDTLFSAGCGRLLGGTVQQLWHSLGRLAALTESTQVYCTHEYTVSNLQFACAIEPDNSAISDHLAKCLQQRSEGRPTLPSSIGLELNINPFLRVNQGTVKRSAEQHAGHPLDSDLTVFAELREWKNHF